MEFSLIVRNEVVSVIPELSRRIMLIKIIEKGNIRYLINRWVSKSTRHRIFSDRFVYEVVFYLENSGVTVGDRCDGETPDGVLR